ncbi:SDR family NAD(P)-dependent oxidoreductase [Desulforhopalus singaporensis]|uniref:3-oxoacyl-[acyl-carrier protein] reductase n=1 Tax=Desulforhopalus singaporensis TaxID=91360 RepID=A0A1H0PDU9_9BACT|nr:SDR family oxidoreductase [Desulforhopalus singaporensis]SDP02809.1 3-oxoacyl-[acyl-carrier protein] reductase [Desulforhopalus singaporensis]
MELEGKTALIPGASRPVGRAIAKCFARQGAHLFLPVFDWPESVTELREEFTENRFSFELVQTDLRKTSEVKKLVQTVAARSGKLHYLINNIERGGMPIVHGGYDLAHNRDQWDLEFATSLKAKWLLFHHCLDLMQKCHGCSVVNISSVAGVTGRSGPGALLFNDGYSAANRAISSLTETWARETAPLVRVNELCLGLIRGRHGEGTRGWSLLSDDDKKELTGQILLARTGRPEEVADAVYFLAVRASYLTGAVIRMDGGFSLGATRVPPMPDGVL